jgi:REP element-mobilizing transposase RayT
VARRLRIQYPGALYHVINRGNFRRDIFETAGATTSFLAALGEACERYQFRLHAYTVMCNHYHLALETPLANLVAGMHWLQSTFSSRFNRFRDVHGHLFQGRYQALLVEDAPTLLRVVHYIHLNPVRAKIVTAEALASFRWSSLPAFVNSQRPSWLTAEIISAQLGVSDTAKGWTQYITFLIALAGDSAEQQRLGFSEFERGWAIGTHGWRQKIARDHAHLALAPGIPSAELRDINEARWRDALQQALLDSAKTSGDIAHDPKGVHWKIHVARSLRRTVAAPHRWIAEQLNMGTPAAVRVNVARFS